MISAKKNTDSLSAPDLDYECYYLHLLQYIAIVQSDSVPQGLTFQSMDSSQCHKHYLEYVDDTLPVRIVGHLCIMH